MEMEIAERRRSVREESRVKMEMGNERDEAVVIATATGETDGGGLN